MPDPFSAAASAAGIASLGIQVCKGLALYLRSVEGRKQQIAHDLREVQRLISMFYSLNDILPHINRRGPADSAIIRQCLKDSEQKLQEFQQLLIKRRGPENPTGIPGKMKEAGRLLMYPFCEGRLISLRQTLQTLLDNLNSTIHIASLDLAIAHNDEIHSVKTSIGGLVASSQVQTDEVRDLQTQMHDNFDQLRLVQSTVTDSLNNIEQRLARTQWSIQDVGQNASGRLTMIQTDTQSIASTSLMTSERITEVMEKLNQMHPILNQIKEATGNHHMISQSSFDVTGMQNPQSSVFSSTQVSCVTRSQNTNLRRAAIAGPVIKSPNCDCPSESHSATYLYTFRGLEIRYDHQEPPKHRRGCKFYGINRKAQRSFNAQIPLTMGWLSTSIKRVCVAYTSGCSDLGMSIRLKNVVLSEYCPVTAECRKLKSFFYSHESQCSKSVVRQLKMFERAVLSLYREGKASPSDRDQLGQSHLKKLLKVLLRYETCFRITSDQSIMAAVFQILQNFEDLVPVEGENLSFGSLFYNLSDGYYAMDLDQQISIQRLISHLGDAFEIDMRDILFWNKNSGSVHLIKQVSIVNCIAISPIARAILLQSLGDLEAEILRDPKAPMETFYGCTTLQLCAVWPQGLQKLLETEAKNLIEGCGKQHICSEAICYCYDVPFTYAIRWQCAESVDLLMKAGCSMSSDASTFYGLSSTTNECAAVIASNLAERRQTLLELAHQEFADLQHQDPPHVADTAAAHLCKVLKNAGIAIPRSLEVGRDYTTIYHCPGIPIHHFQIYFEQGFVDFKLHNNIGLTPIMVWRETFDVVNHCRSDQVFEAFLWLHKQGFLDQTPEDPLAIGLNIHATGWHYVGAMLGATCEEWLQDSDFETPLAWKVIRILSQTTMRDHCACWCNPKGEGCSPLKSLWNAHTDHRGMMLYHSQTQRAISFSHILFHHDLNVTGIEDDKPSNLSLQLIRLLTFEALDMTHTCCSLERLNLQEKRLCVASDYGNHGFYDCKTALVIANRDPELLQRIRSNIRERENAHQLGFLMKEFTAQLKRLDPSPKALEIFIWGHWRRRMSELFIVQSEILEETEQILGNVRTYVVPERLQFFLGEDFDWLRPEAQATPEQEESEEDDDASSVENVGVSRYCEYCDGR